MDKSTKKVKQEHVKEVFEGEADKIINEDIYDSYSFGILIDPRKGKAVKKHESHNMKHTITFLTAEGELIDLHVGTKDGIPSDVGYWNVDKNQVLLGAYRWSEWHSLGQDNTKRRKFLEKLEKVSQILLT